MKGKSMGKKDTDAIEFLLDNALGIMMVFMENGQVLFLNETGKKELGYQAKPISLLQIFPNLLDEEKDISAQIAKQAGQEIHLPVYRANRTCFPGRLRYAMTRVEEGKAIYLSSIVNLQDQEDEVNELAKLEEKVKENMRKRNEFVANITHELRTPVNGIKGHVENLRAEEQDPEKRKTLDIVVDCCVNMQKIINNLLDFSKIEAGKFEIQEEPFNLRNCVNHTIDTSMMMANEKGIKLSAYISDNVPEEVIGDELRVMQILNNLISNAVKFTTVGYVRVEVYNTMVSGDEVELTFFVIDTGIGVSLEEKDRMFKSFSQVDGSITRQYGGTGLGLYVCRQMVELMHGHIDLESEKGKGSTFQFNIRLKMSEKVAKEQQKKERKEAVREKSKIVEELRENMRRYQEENGMEQLYIFGSKENKRELGMTLEKLLLCIEMKNWNKAEQFAENIKKLCEQAPKEIKSQVFKMLMAIRKEDYEKSILLQGQLAEQLE